MHTHISTHVFTVYLELCVLEHSTQITIKPTRIWGLGGYDMTVSSHVVGCLSLDVLSSHPEQGVGKGGAQHRQPNELKGMAFNKEFDPD